MNRIQSAVGRVIRRHRKQDGLTLVGLSERSGISVGYLSEVERGRKNLSNERLEILADVFGMGPEALLRLIADEISRD